MKNSIAENHLSKHGRFGDTEITSTSKGELWHVNKHEKKLIDDYGTVGERLVNISGSGTINPTTGLKLGETSNLLGESVSSQLKFLTEQSQVEKEKLGKQMKNIDESVSKAQSMSGFATASDIEQQKVEAITGVREQEESLMTSFGAKVGDVIGMFKSEKSRIKSERERLEFEKKLYDSMSDKKFLGIF